MARFFQYLVFLLFRAVESALVLFSIGICASFGAGLGFVGWCVALPYRRLVERNLSIAYGEELSPEEIRELGRRHFVALGRNFMCSIRLGMMKPENVRKRVRYENMEHLNDAFEDGNGVITTIAHMGPWELLSMIDYGDRKRGAMYQPLSNPFLNRQVVETRAQDGTTLFDRRKSFYQPMKHIRDGGGLGILVDQSAGDHGVWCPLFHRLASTTNLAALISIRTGAPLVSIGIYPDGPGRWLVRFGKPVRPRDASGAELSSAAITAQMNQELERMIRLQPEEWFWVHNRWKTPLPEFLLTAYRRGVKYPDGYDEEQLKPFRILVRSPNWLGDACMSVPAVRAIRKGRPDAHVTVLCNEGIADLWRSVEEVDAVLTKPKNGSVLEVRKRIREEAAFEVGILLTNSLRTALEMKAAEIPIVTGYAGHQRRPLLTHVIPEPAISGPPEHHARRYMRIAEHLGADIRDPDLTPKAPGKADPKRPSKIALCPGAAYGPAKQYPLDQLARAVEQVQANLQEEEVEWLMFGGPGEAELAKKFADECSVPFTDRAGKTTLEELIAEIRECRIVVTNDSGTMHLAALYGVPTVAFFGSTEPALTGPVGDQHRVLREHVPCSPCFQRECPLDFRCMHAIRPEMVSRAILELSGKTVSTVPS